MLACYRNFPYCIAGTSRILQGRFRPDSDSSFVTVGQKHVKFWTVAGSQLVPKKAVIGSNETVKLQTMVSIAFAAGDVTYTGCITGEIFFQRMTQR